MATFIVVGLATFAGAVAQRTTGIGFALIVAPVFIILFGPLSGVTFTNLCGSLAATIVLWQSWRNVEWKRVLPFAIAGAAGVGTGTLFLWTLGGKWLPLIVALLVFAISLSTLVRLKMRFRDGWSARLLTGLLAGFTTATAGSGGAVAATYAQSTRWPTKYFIASIQVHFVTVGLLSILIKRNLPEVSLYVVFVALAGFVLGLLVGSYLLRQVSNNWLKEVVRGIAIIGSGAVVIRQLWFLYA